MTGNSADMISRLKSLLPKGWFARLAPLRDAVLGGVADQLAAAYAFIGYAKMQTRIRTATGPWLDLVAFDYFNRHIKRRGSGDDTFRKRILVELLRERVTRAGMVRALTDLTGRAPWVFEPWNTGDAGGWDTGYFAFAGSDSGSGGGRGYDSVGAAWDINTIEYDAGKTVAAVASGGAGGWGDTNLPAQVFLIAYRPGLQGIPSVDGYDGSFGGFDQGSIEWTDPSMIAGAVTDADILDAINATKPTGVIVWTNLQ